MAAERDGPQLVRPPAVVYRVGHSADVSEFTPWQWQKGEARWDDPLIAEIRRRVAASLGVDKSNEDDERVDDEFVFTVDGIPQWHRPFRVLYTSATRHGAFVEVLQDFRKAKKVRSEHALQRLSQIEEDSSEIERDDPARARTGIVPERHLETLHVGYLSIAPCEFADLGHVKSVQFVREPMLGEARRHNLGDVNVGSILSNVRAFTQALSAWLYFDFDARPLGGVRHGSTLGHPHENWAIFETVGLAATTPRAVLGPSFSMPAYLEDPDLHGALNDLGLHVQAAQ